MMLHPKKTFVLVKDVKSQEEPLIVFYPPFVEGVVLFSRNPIKSLRNENRNKIQHR